MRSFVHGGNKAVSIEADAGSVVIRNRAQLCIFSLRDGSVQIRPASLRAGPGLQARAGVITASGTSGMADGVGPIQWQIKPPPPSFAGAVMVEFRRALPQAGAWFHCRVAAGETHFLLQTGVAGLRETVSRFITMEDADCRRALLPSRMLRVAYCGAHSGSPLSRSEASRVSAASESNSWWTTAFLLGKKASLVMGYLTARRFLGRFDLRQGRLTAFNYGEGVVASSKQVTWSEPLYLAFTHEPLPALRHYADLAAQAAGNRKLPAPVSGWGSWTHHGAEVDEKTVLRNAAEVAAWGTAPDGNTVVHVDHGWEERHQLHRPKFGWRTRPGFSRNLRGLGDSLQSMQLRLGLWVVPFAINVDRPGEWRLPGASVKDGSGKPWSIGGNEGCFCIDPTHPTGEQWLRELFRKLRRTGASYYKLDFLRVLLSHDPDDPRDGLDQLRLFHGRVTRTEAYRRGLEIIREEVGASAYLLGCGAPLLPSAGLIDGCRIGPDIEACWDNGRSGIKACTSSLLCNFFWQGRVWWNDPDFLVIPRGENLLRFWGTAVALSGGSMLASTDLSRLSRRRRELLQALQPARGESATPLDLGSRGEPERWALPISAHGDEFILVGLFNGKDRSRSLALQLSDFAATKHSGDGIAWDFWRQRQIGGIGRRWKIRLDGRDAALIGIKPVLNRPQLIASSAHFAMGAEEFVAVNWSAPDQALTCSLVRPPGGPLRVYFLVPSSFRLHSISVGRARRRGQILRVILDGGDATDFTLTFAPSTDLHESPRKNQVRRR